MRNFIFIIISIFFIWSCSCSSNNKTVKKNGGDHYIEISSDSVSPPPPPPNMEEYIAEDEYSEEIAEPLITESRPPAMSREDERSHNLENWEEDEDMIEEIIAFSIVEDTLPFYEDDDYGEINYVLADTMIVGEVSVVEITISSGVELSVIIEEVESFTPENVHSDNVRISKTMRIRLVDPVGGNFTITPITAEKQFIENNQFTKWEWDVVPLVKGNHKLKLTVDMIVDNNSKTIEVYEDFIYVYSDETVFEKIFSFLGNNWEWFLSTLFIPLFIFVYNKRKKKEE